MIWPLIAEAVKGQSLHGRYAVCRRGMSPGDQTRPYDAPEKIERRATDMPV
jgi:hypothetical protein